MAKVVTLGKHQFVGRSASGAFAEARRFLKAIKDAATYDEPLSEEHTRMVAEAAFMGPNRCSYARERMNGENVVLVRVVDNRGPCFELVGEKGTTWRSSLPEYFLDPYRPAAVRKVADRAMRDDAHRPQAKERKLEEEHDRLDYGSVCIDTDAPLNQLDADHWETDFSKLRDAFLKSKRLTLKDVPAKVIHQDGTATITDERLRTEWQRYHRDNAQYQLLERSEHKRVTQERKKQ